MWDHLVRYIRQPGDLATGQLSSRLLPHQYAEDPPGAFAPGGSRIARLLGVQPGDEGPSTCGSSLLRRVAATQP